MEQTLPFGSWLRSEASAATLAGLESWVVLLALVLVLVVGCVWVSRRQRYHRQRRRPEVRGLLLRDPEHRRQAYALPKG